MRSEQKTTFNRILSVLWMIVKVMLVLIYGCGFYVEKTCFAIYRLVILPSIKPVLMVVALFAFRSAWNDYLWPTIVMNEPNNQTLTSGLALLKGQYDVAQWTNLLASTIISMIAPLALYLCCQQYFLKGISVSASVKG